MQLGPRELSLLHECVLTRLQFLDSLISQENNRPEDQRGLLPGFTAQLLELQSLSNRLAEGIAAFDNAH